MTQQQQTSTAPTIPTPPRSNRIGMVALTASLVGAVLAIAVVGVRSVLPAALGVLVVALILAIVGLTRPGLSKATSVVALILSIVFGVAAPVLFVVGNFVADFSTTMSGGRSVGPEESNVGSIGQKFTDSTGVEVTVASVKCGLTEINDFGMVTKPRGQFCVANIEVFNGSTEKISLMSMFTGLVGDWKYPGQAIIGSGGAGMNELFVPPGFSHKASFAIDIPADRKLEYIQVDSTDLGKDPLLVRVS